MLKEFLIILAEPVPNRAVQIEDTEQFAILHQWQNNFRPGFYIAGDVSFERIDVTNTLNLQGFRRRTANPFSHRNQNACRPALKRSNHQLTAFDELESDPIDFIHHLEQDSRKVRGIGNDIVSH